MVAPPRSYNITLRRPYDVQTAFVDCPAKRVVIRAGRRGGKTTGISIKAGKEFLKGRRVLYATPTADQISRFWFEITKAFAEPIAAGVLYKNETQHILEVPGTENRIRAKTAYNAETLRGDYADLLILDEFQLMNEDTWELVGVPMLLDNNGDAVFIYTPPSLSNKQRSQATDKRYAAKLYKKAEDDDTGRWAAFHFTSMDNPTLSVEALDEIAQDMTSIGYRQEIMAEDMEDAPGALWKRAWIDATRIEQPRAMRRIVVAIDPAVTSSADSDETGIIAAGVAGVGKGIEAFILKDRSGRYSPRGWAEAAINLYDEIGADRIIGEVNNGGDMVEATLRIVRQSIPYKAVHASRGKAARAEPVVAFYEKAQVHHVGQFPELEDQLCTWEPLSGQQSPDRLDAAVWALTELLLGGGTGRIGLYV